MVPAAATGALFVVLTVLSQIIARSRRRKAHPSGDTAADGAGAPGLGMGMGGRKALSRNRAEVVHSLLGLAGSACAVAAVALFVAWDQVFLGILAGVAGFALIAVRQRVLEHSRLQEGMDAKAQWDREQAADPTESGLSGREENR